MKACNFNHGGQCCNCGAPQYMVRCKQPCDYMRPATRFERIKAMTVEELAEFLSDIVECCYYGKCERCAIYKVTGSVDCVSEDIKKYLESEVDESDNISL